MTIFYVVMMCLYCAKFVEEDHPAFFFLTLVFMILTIREVL